MVKAMVDERNSAADEAGALQRNISGLNARIRTLTDDLEQANRARKSLRSNLRRQVINELRGAGWKAPQGYTNSGFDDSDDDDGDDASNIFGSGGRNGGKKNGKKTKKKTENPIAKMRRLREALTQSGSSSMESSSKNAIPTAKSTMQSGDSRPGSTSSTTSNGGGPPVVSSSASTPTNAMTPPPSTPETTSNNTLAAAGGGGGGGGKKQMLASDLGSPIDIVDRNPRDIGFAPPDSDNRENDLQQQQRGINGASGSSRTTTPVEDSMNRTERFLEKRRKRDQALQSQVDKDVIKRESRESIHEAQVGQRSRRISSRVGRGRLPGL